MTNSKSSNGYKKVRYSRRPQRRQKAQKRKNEQQKHLSSQSVLDRNDRAIGFSKWQQQRITLSQLILPKPSNSTQKDGNEIKTIQQKKKTTKIDNKQNILEAKNVEKKQKNLEKDSNEETQKTKEGNDVKENGKKFMQIGAKIADEGQKQLENGKMEEMPKPKGKDNSKENKKKKGGKTAEKTAKPKEDALGQNGQPQKNQQNQNGKEIEGKKKQQNNASSAEENPLLIPLINGCSKVEDNKMNGSKSVGAENHQNEAQNETALNGVSSPLTIDTFSEGINRENDGMDEAILTECSTDSGIEIINNGTDGNDSPTQKSSQTIKSTDGAVDKKEEPKVSKFEKRVYEFVDEVTEKMEMKTALLVTNESVAPMLQPLKVEPLNLERIRFSEKKRNKKPRQYKLLESDIEYCKYMAEKYGQEYEAMTHDAKNVFGDSAKSLERKLRIYKDFLKQQSNGDGV